MNIKNFLDKLVDCLGRSGVNRSPDERTKYLEFDEFEPYLDVSDIEKVVKMIERVVFILSKKDLFGSLNVSVEKINKDISELKEYILSFERKEESDLEKRVRDLSIDIGDNRLFEIDPNMDFYRGFTEKIRDLVNILADDEFALSRLYIEIRQDVSQRHDFLDYSNAKESVRYKPSDEFVEIFSELYVFGETLRNKIEILSAGLLNEYKERGGSSLKVDRRIKWRRVKLKEFISEYKSLDILSYTLAVGDNLMLLSKKVDGFLEEGNERAAIAYMLFMTNAIVDSLNSDFVKAYQKVVSIEYEDKMFLSYVLLPIVLYYCLLNQCLNDLIEKTGGK